MIKKQNKNKKHAQTKRHKTPLKGLHERAFMAPCKDPCPPFSQTVHRNILTAFSHQCIYITSLFVPYKLKVPQIISLLRSACGKTN